MPATNATGSATLQTVPGDICVLAIHNTFLTQEEIIVAYTDMWQDTNSVTRIITIQHLMDQTIYRKEDTAEGGHCKQITH